MTKVAIFCEGETEQLFTGRLFEEIIGSQCQLQFGKLLGRAGARYMVRKYHAEMPTRSYLIRIFDCGGGGGESVLSNILELTEKFIKEHGYNFIIGICDVYPRSRDRIPTLIESAKSRVPKHPVPGYSATVFHILSIMEIEAWFLAEYKHFLLISPSLTCAAIRAQMHFDPSADDMQLRDHPAWDLECVYQLAGTSYNIERTVMLLDMNRIYLELPNNYPPLRELVEAVETVYAAEQGASDGEVTPS